MNSHKYSRPYLLLLMAEHRRSQKMIKAILKIAGETSYFEFKKRAALTRALRAEQQALANISAEMEMISESGFFPERTLSVETILNS